MKLASCSCFAYWTNPNGGCSDYGVSNLGLDKALALNKSTKEAKKLTKLWTKQFWWSLKFSNKSPILKKKIVLFEYGRAHFCLLHNLVFDKNISNFGFQKVEILKQVDMYYIGVNHKHYFSKYSAWKFKISTNS